MNIDNKEICSYLSKFRFPLYTKKLGEPIDEYLDTFFKEYTKNLKSYKLDSKIIRCVERECNQIITIIKKYLDNDIVDSYNEFYKLLKAISPHLTTLSFPLQSKSGGYYDSMYRIRAGRADENYNDKDLFHIPKHLRRKISQARYSIQGIPCLYLTVSNNTSSIPWYEVGCPLEFYTCKFNIGTENFNSLKIIDFTKNMLWEYKSKQPSLDIIHNDIITLPLRVSCSIVNEEKSNHFKEEYIIPQMLMTWVRKSKSFIGIAYHPCTIVAGETNNWCAINIAFSVKSFGDNGLDENLYKFFKIGKEEKDSVSGLYHPVNQVTFINFMKKFDNEFDTEKLNKIRIFYFNKKSDMQTYKHILQYKDMLSICSGFLSNISLLREDPKNIKTIIDNFITYYSSAKLILDNLNALILCPKKMVDSIDYCSGCNINEVRNMYIETINEFKEIIEIFKKLSDIEKYVWL